LKNILEKFCEAIAYPDPVPDGVSAFTLRVDGGDILARLLGGRLVLSCVVSSDEKDLPKLAAYAAGRILKEEAVLAWDEKQAACIVWQGLRDNADAAQLSRFFEEFMKSCDWWLARAGELSSPPPELPDIVIRP